MLFIQKIRKISMSEKESFLMTEEDILKLVKLKYSPASLSRIRRWIKKTGMHPYKIGSHKTFLRSDVMWCLKNGIASSSSLTDEKSDDN